MRTITIGKLIDLSINRSKLILFQPFSLKKWLCLIMIAHLAGALGGCGNGGNGGNYHRSRKSQTAQISPAIKQNNPEIKLSQYQAQDTLYRDTEQSSYPYSDQQTYNKKSSSFPPMAIAITIGIFLLILPIIILFTWLSSRFKFIWFDSIVANDASITEPFRKRKNEGNSLFEFYLSLLLITLAFFGFIAFWIFAAARANGLMESNSIWSFGKVISTFLVPGLLAIAGIIFLIFLHIAIDQFVVTIMAMDKCSFKTAWSKFIEIYKENLKEFWFYILVIIGLGIICAIIAMTLVLILLIPLLVVAAIIFGIPFLLFKLTPLFLAIAVVLGIPFLTLFILLMFGVSLPFAVFFRSFSLYFLSSIECQYNPLEI